MLEPVAGVEVLWTPHLSNLGHTFPARPVIPVKVHERHCRRGRLFLRLELKDGKPTDDLLCLGKGTIADGNFSSREPHARSRRGRGQPASRDHLAGLGLLFGDLRNGIHKRLRWRAFCFRRFDYGHESHFQYLLLNSSLESALSIEDLLPASTHASNKQVQDRHIKRFFLPQRPALRRYAVKNSFSTGVMTFAFSMCVWPSRVRCCALGRTSASACIAWRIQAGLLPPSATSVGTVTDAHCSGGKGLPRWLSCTIVMS